MSNDEIMEDSTEKLPVIEGDRSSEVGILMIKPDAIKLGVEEYLVAEFVKRLEGRADLDYAVVKTIESEETVREIYPDLEDDTYKALYGYLIGKEVLLITFRAKNNTPGTDMLERLSSIRGPSMWRWSKEQLSGNVGPEDFVRRMMPVPGSPPEWNIIKEKALQKERMTQREFEVYCQNLVHTPTSKGDFNALLKLFSEKERKFILR